MKFYATFKLNPGDATVTIQIEFWDHIVQFSSVYLFHSQ